VLKERKKSAPSAIKMFSSVTGKALENSRGLDAKYWRQNLESPVLFETALSALTEIKVDALLEIGPHSALSGPINDHIKQKELQTTYTPTLKRDEDSVRTLLFCVGTLFQRGLLIDFEVVNTVINGEGNTLRGNLLTDLPAYAWEPTKPKWNQNRYSQEFRERKHMRHDLLGSRLPSLDPCRPSWRNILRVKDLSWLQDHKANGGDVNLLATIFYPGRLTNGTNSLYIG
jgi:acyl transferase domain-containing protein